MNVVIVESPAKAKTINKYLGSDYTVLASFGHVRDLPQKDGAVNPDDDFAMDWETDRDSEKRLKDIAAAVRNADRLYLATDPDREGEAISWHVLEVLSKKRALKGVDVKRVVFNEITKSAILKAMGQPRDLDDELIHAYLARRALDYLVGFTLSPVLWRKLPGARSAGRVQSVALRLVCEREREIEAFTPQEYWTVEAALKSAGGQPFKGRLAVLEGKKLKKMDLSGEAAAKAAAKRLETGPLTVRSVEKKPTKRHPQPPFTTSTLQQEAARKLGFTATRTMQVAQKLYEGKELGGEVTGLITYMRTDGVTIAGEALAATRSMVEERFGPDYLPDAPRAYKTKAKNAQEAHEAIRPTSPKRKPGGLKNALTDEEYKLYDLIWKRTVASQMESARLESTSVAIANGDGTAELKATGSVITFDGFMTLYMEGKDDEGDDDEARLPRLSEGETITATAITPEQHFTAPPPRYTEASLVRKLEELGIGRPSTYAAILTKLRDRDYVSMDRKRFVPADKGRLVTNFLEKFFARYVEYDFTASLEEQLDRVSAGDVDWKALLRDFWHEFKPRAEEVKAKRNAEIIDVLDEMMGPAMFPPREDGSDPRTCPKDGGRLGLKLSRNGPFIGCGNYPDCTYTRPFGTGEDADAAPDGPMELGTDPDSGEMVTLRTGRFGPYVQLGEAVKGAKPKRGSIPKDWDPATLDLEKALALLRLPRTVGTHPEDGEPITAAIGRFGPYVKHKSTYANLPTVDDVFTVGLNHAVTLIADKAARRGGNKRILKELGEHPEKGGPVSVMDGRYGPYVNHKRTNATLPKDQKPEDVTLEDAITMLAEKAAKGSGKKAPAKKTPAKSAAKKTSAKKAPAKKAPARKSTASKDAGNKSSEG
ncbi:type I DNA topoisomerase [Yunchengibacter salinarum]|uniref:type I DNA topoisomerase n=1 Tax=Yunchengibacter salinarum TaxID=3133399 RepID=UPI0035B57EC1